MIPRGPLLQACVLSFRGKVGGFWHQDNVLMEVGRCKNSVLNSHGFYPRRYR